MEGGRPPRLLVRAIGGDADDEPDRCLRLTQYSLVLGQPPTRQRVARAVSQLGVSRPPSVRPSGSTPVGPSEATLSLAKQAHRPSLRHRRSLTCSLGAVARATPRPRSESSWPAGAYSGGSAGTWPVRTGNQSRGSPERSFVASIGWGRSVFSAARQSADPLSNGCPEPVRSQSEVLGDAAGGWTKP